MKKTFEVGESYRSVRPHYNSGVECCDQDQWYVYLTVTRKTDKSIWFDKSVKYVARLGRPVNEPIVYRGNSCYRYHLDKYNGYEVATKGDNYLHREFLATEEELKKIPLEDQVWH